MTATMDRKEFATLQARFARRGYELQRVFLVGTKWPTYHVSRNTQSRIFSHPHDLAGYLAVVEGMPV